MCETALEFNSTFPTFRSASSGGHSKIAMASHERDRESAYDDFSEENNSMSPTDSAFGFSSSGSSYFSSPSGFSSPFGSEIGSTETESEEDFIAELSQLTRRMAEYTFQDDEVEIQKPFPADALSKDSEPNGLPMKFNSSSVHFCKEGSTKASEKVNSDSEICPDQVLTDERMRHLQVYQLKNQPQTKTGHGGKRVKEVQNMQSHNRGGKGWRKRMMNSLHPSVVSASAQAGSGMRAVFLGGSNTKSGSGGTGVFLPTVTYSTATAEPKRKAAGCSTVLIPARVLQTLQQHFNNVGAQSQSNCADGSTNPWRNDVLARINGLLSQQKEHAEFQTRPPTAPDKEELKLPQEWTY